jgi:hypothetical protein
MKRIVSKSVVKKKKLDPTHVFLQFLMMFLTLCFLIGASYFVQEILWFDNFETTISLISGALSIIIANLFFYRSSLKGKEKRGFFLFGIFFFLLGILIVVGTTLGILTVANRVLLEFPLIFTLLALFLALFVKKDWRYDNLTFWEIFSTSLFIFAKLFLVMSFLFVDVKLIEFSYIVELFAYVAILIGAINEVYEALGTTRGAKKAKKK